MDPFNRGKLRTKLPRFVNQLVYIKQRRDLERAIGLFHAAWTDLEWRIWALDTAHQGDGVFKPLTQASTRRFLERPHESLNKPIQRLHNDLALKEDLIKLNRRRNHIIHGSIAPNHVEHPNIYDEPLLISSKLMGIIWPETHVVPTMKEVFEGKMGRYKRMYRKTDISDMTNRVMAVTRELDARHLRSLQTATIRLVREKLEQIDENRSLYQAHDGHFKGSK